MPCAAVRLDACVGTMARERPMGRLCLVLFLCLGLGACDSGTVEEGVAAFEARDFEAARKILRPHAEKGDAEAQYRLATMITYGRGTKKNPKKGFPWYQKAAEQGHMGAQSALGQAYYYGQEGLSRDRKTGFTWYLKAAEQGDHRSQLRAAQILHAGEYVAKDMAEAVRWYRRAAEQGNNVAQYILGEVYLGGDGIAKDEAEAARWYRLGAEQGEPSSAIRLGSLYENGRGVPQDDEEAIRWYRVAAQYDNVDPFAQQRLDFLYQQGRATREQATFGSKSSYYELN